jgi:hypothetical protein
LPYINIKCIIEIYYNFEYINSAEIIISTNIFKNKKFPLRSNTLKNSLFFLPLTISAALVLSACGGGDSSSDSTSTNTPQQSTFSSITAENSTQAASNAYAAHVSINDSSSAVSAVLTGVSIDGPGVSMVAPALGMINRAYNKGSMKLLAGVSMSEACSGGGTISVNGSMRSEDVASNGDALAFTTNNCVEGGIILNGAFTITLSNISGAAFTSNIWNATIDTRFNEFSVTMGGETVAATGDMKITVTQASSISNSIAISGSTFRTSQIIAGVKVAERTLFDYSVAGTTQGTTFSGSASYTMTGNSKGLGQFAYSVKTLQPFVSVNGAIPRSGALIVNGSSSSVTMTVLDTNNVRLEYRANTDGGVTKTDTVSWASFNSSL